MRYERALLKRRIPPATRRTSSTEKLEEVGSLATFLMGSPGESAEGAGRLCRASMVDRRKASDGVRC